MASFSNRRTAARLIEPPSTARHSGPPSATGWMTGASPMPERRKRTGAQPPEPHDQPHPPPARLTRPRQAPTAGVNHPRPQHAALDPAALAWQPRNQPGAKPRDPSNHGPHHLPTHQPRCQRQKLSPHPLTSPGPSWMTQDVFCSGDLQAPACAPRGQRRWRPAAELRDVTPRWRRWGRLTSRRVRR